MKDKTGGPAFPAIAQMSDQHLRVEWPGMTLRDYFAGQALVGRLACGGWERSTAFIQNEVEVAFKIADAMLAERARREPDNDG